jgi:uncharacterized protein (TIGR03086 family)
MKHSVPTSEAIVNWTALLADSHAALRSVAIAGDQPTPCDKWTVTQVLQHAAGDQIGYAAAITGGPGPGYDPFAPSGRLEGDPRAFVDEALDRSAAAWSTVDPQASAVPTPLPQGPLPAWLAGGACALDAAVHAWDIAVALGRPSPLTEAMAVDLLVVAREIVEPLRAWGAYAPALPLAPGEDQDHRATLLAYVGRDPAWRP